MKGRNISEEIYLMKVHFLIDVIGRKNSKKVLGREDKEGKRGSIRTGSGVQLQKRKAPEGFPRWAGDVRPAQEVRRKRSGGKKGEDLKGGGGTSKQQDAQTAYGRKESKRGLKKVSFRLLSG